jgi:tRNA(fMet)-specific endonuclease VapC
MIAVDPSCRVHLPLAVVGKLLYGANCAPNPERQLGRVRAFAARSNVVYPNQETAEIYGRIKTELRRRGRMIPENDLWIAATAIQHEMPVLTQDSHFQEVPGVVLLTW